jgi:hypothetical protein
MSRKDRQGKSKNQTSYSEMVAGISFMVILAGVLIYYFYQIITM